ncbi:unnamed protein product (macronuclear) [Paramecium tetraurelia]|uniref:Uncharacterized protein n=1 Tax=Paramecium tetraurelia TaxID=5888 RepID=A0DDH3_PARTE|nr:uncharacterized protein GSPATT00015950001 [Paramecium tetraurelia]CAK81090.1 unnamed protein product [Paramecium tetraurelia]|eukprot:XP_001448487.1 hypothetical protein (macronuclear) [Paramecium tetraurelia strain d4-2]
MISQIFFIYWQISISINCKFISGFGQVTNLFKGITKSILKVGLEINLFLSIFSGILDKEISNYLKKYMLIRQAKTCINELKISRNYCSRYLAN